jgi:hypothetical protein
MTVTHGLLRKAGLPKQLAQKNPKLVSKSSVKDRISMKCP